MAVMAWIWAFWLLSKSSEHNAYYLSLIHICTRIVFTTAFDQYAIDGYKVNALDYLLKPISYVDFLQAANKAVQW